MNHHVSAKDVTQKLAKTFTAFCCAGSARCFKSGLLPKSYQRETGNCPKRYVSGEARVGCASSHPASPNPKKPQP